MNLAYHFMCGTGVDKLIRRAIRPKGLIFMGHSVGPRPGTAGSDSPLQADFDPNRQWRVSSEQLDSAISCALDYGYEGVSLDVAVERMHSSRQHPPFFVVTFDDGYVDNLTHALPVCAKHDLPMHTYVTSGFVQRTHVAWWHVLEFLISEQDKLVWHWQGIRNELACNTPKQKYASFERMSEAFTQSTPLAINLSMENLRSSYGDGAWQYSANLFLTADQLRKFSKQPGVGLGVHTVSHAALNAVDAKSVVAELQICQRSIQEVTGLLTRHLAYPFGSQATVSAAVCKIAQQQGYLSAVTTQHGVVFGSKQTLMAIPRVLLAPSDTESSLRCKLSGVTTLMKRCITRAPAYAI